MAILSERLKELRKEAGLTQEDLAGKLEVNSKTISKWETGEQQPSDDNIYSLMRILNVQREYLTGDEDYRECPFMSDEDAAAAAEAEERRYEKQIIEMYRDLGSGSRRAFQIMLTALWKADKEEGKLLSQYKEE